MQVHFFLLFPYLCFCRYSHFRKCTVRVHEAVGIAEALQISALFQQEQGLLMDDTPTLQAKVAVCRRLLHTMHDLDEDSDEPPARVQDSWRKQAAAALGCLSSHPRVSTLHSCSDIKLSLLILFHVFYRELGIWKWFIVHCCKYSCVFMGGYL